MRGQNTIEDFFRDFHFKLENIVPVVISEVVINDIRQNFDDKGFNGKPWPDTKRKIKKGSLMVRTGALQESVVAPVISRTLVRVSAGNAKVPYARVHNEGDTISRAARSETFTRNRAKAGKKKGQFRKGTSDGQGFSFKAYSYKMSQRQFMGHSEALNKKVKEALEAALNKR